MEVFISGFREVTRPSEMKSLVPGKNRNHERPPPIEIKDASCFLGRPRWSGKQSGANLLRTCQNRG